MDNLRDRIAQALTDRVLAEATGPLEPGTLALVERSAANADVVMPIVNSLASDLDHAERTIRRLETELARHKQA